MAARRKFSFELPARRSRRVDARNLVDQFRQGGNGILQAEVHAPQDAVERFVAERRRFGCRALALVQGRHTEDRAVTEAVTVQREFCTGAQQQLVVDFEQRFAFKSDLDFLIRIKRTFAQKFNLSQLVVDFVVDATCKYGRACGQLFCAGRNIHTRARTYGMARIRVTHANRRIAALTDRLEVEAARIAVQVVNRQVVQLRHRIRRVQQPQWFQAVLAGTFRRFRPGVFRKRFTRQPHFSRKVTAGIFLENRSVIDQRASRRRIGQAQSLEERSCNAGLVLHAQNKTAAASFSNSYRVHVAQHQLVNIRQFGKGRIPLDQDDRRTITNRRSCTASPVIAPAGGQQRTAIHAVHLKDTRLGIIAKVRRGDLDHAFHQFLDSLSRRRLVDDRDIFKDVLRHVHRTALVKLEVRRRITGRRLARNGRVDIIAPRLVVQEVIAVRNELLVQNLEFRRRLAGIDRILFLTTAVLRRDCRESPVPQFPFRLDTEQALMVLGITRKFRAGQRKRCRTGFYALQDVIFKFVLVRFLVHHAHLVLHTEAAFHVVDLDRDVRANLTLHHKTRVVSQCRRRPEARLGTALGIVLLAVSLEADIHGTLQHQLGLVETEVPHPRRHRHRNRDIEHRTRLGRFVAVVPLPDKAVEPQVLATHIVHVGHVVRQFRIVRRP